MLFAIARYDEFFDQQKAVLVGYPQTVETEIKLYADSVGLFFGIERIVSSSSWLWPVVDSLHCTKQYSIVDLLYSFSDTILLKKIE